MNEKDNKQKISIFIVMHKVIQIYKNENFIPLLVGAKNYKEKVPKEIEKDDSILDNISDKNKNYCELTGVYWIWKNNLITYDEIIGLCHYRRYFIKNIFSVKKDNYIKSEDINKIMKKYDIILPKRRVYKKKMKDSFLGAPKKEDMEKTREIIKKLYPEYIESFDKFVDGKIVYFYNMFIAPKRIMNDYFKWLFDILFELEKQIDISSYNEYEKRIYGFISERLLNVWIIKNRDRLKIKEKYVYNEADTFFSFLKHEIVSTYRRIIYGN